MLPEVAIDSVLWECLCMCTKHFAACEPRRKDAGNLGIFMHVDLPVYALLSLYVTVSAPRLITSASTVNEVT